ncbi:MAG: protein-export chaperone SecB [Gammaproteobacteria bacterium]
MNETPTPVASPEPAEPPERQFSIEAIYLKDCSFESPLAPAILGTPNLAPEIKVNLQTAINGIRDNPHLHEVVLTVTLEARWQDRVTFLAEIHQAALLLLRGFTDEEKGPLLGAYAPGLLYPYARELLASLVNRGGFPSVLLQPVNFEAIYQQHLMQATQASPGHA